MTSAASSKKATARASMELRGGEAGVVLGSSNAVWKMKRGPSDDASNTLNIKHSSCARGAPDG